LEKYFLARNEIIVYKLVVDDVPTVKSKLEITCRLAGFSDVEKLAEFRAHDRNYGDEFVRKEKYLRALLDRLKAGHCCFLAEKGTKILGYVWIAFKELDCRDFNRKMVLEENEAVFYDGYVASSHRGKSIGSENNVKAIQHMRANGYKTVYVFVDSFNKISRRASEKSGGKIIGTIIYLRILSMTRLLLTPDLKTLTWKNA
jgi:hypothetical protein